MSATGVSTKSMAVPEIAIMEDVVGGAARHVWAQPQAWRSGAWRSGVQRRSVGASERCSAGAVAQGWGVR